MNQDIRECTHEKLRLQGRLSRWASFSVITGTVAILIWISTNTTGFIAPADRNHRATVALDGARPTSQFQPEAQPPTGPLSLDSCAAAECHADVKEHSFLHGPLFVNACDQCHILTDEKNHLYDFARPKAQLCTFCHEFDLTEDRMTHRPFAAGECITCHDPHGANNIAFKRSERDADLCLSCHQEFTGAAHLAHGPVADGACTTCHQPHASKNRKLLATSGRDLCLSCHADVQNALETSHFIHDPVLSDCQLCHDPHATDSPSLLRAQPQQLCLQCHTDIEHKIDEATTTHGAITTEQSCLNCHEAHASEHQTLLKGPVMSLCFQCHDKQIKRDDGSTIPDMKTIIETGTSLHGAIAAGSCIACHQIHGSANSRLLVQPYPHALYDEFSEQEYALCLNCHDRALVTAEQTAVATGFRNGSQNLHFVHVKKDKRGHTCSVCHDVHAANSKNHIHETVPFGPGGWRLPIGYRPTQDGGRCASGCHESRAYDRKHAFDNPPINPGG